MLNLGQDLTCRDEKKHNVVRDYAFCGSERYAVLAVDTIYIVESIISHKIVLFVGANYTISCEIIQFLPAVAQTTVGRNDMGGMG